MGILLALLFILQIVGFIIMTLLYLRISKFNNLEKKQQQLMKEMDQSVLVYLSEIKEENNRLIYELDQRTKVQRNPMSNPVTPEAPIVKDFEVPESKLNPHPVPRQFALRSYKKAVEIEKNEKETIQQSEPKPLDDREKAKQLYTEGKSVSDIARELRKGKTEIELLLKFG